MKKSLYLLSSVALLASCSDEIIEDSASLQPQAGQGVAFQVVDNPETRGLVDVDGSSFFFAEQDWVEVFAHNVKKLWYSGDYNNFTTSAYYKATSSQGNPLLTGVDDWNILALKTPVVQTPIDLSETGHFFVAYPTGQLVTAVMTTEPEVENRVPVKFTVEPNRFLNNQAMYNGYRNFESRLLYQYTTIDQKNFWDAVGENIQLNLQSPLYMFEPYMTDVETYSSMFGTLNSVSITSTKNPLVPAIPGMSTVVTPADVTKVGGINYLTSTLSITYPAAVAADLIEIGGQTYLKKSCKKEGEIYILTSASVLANVGDLNVCEAPIYDASSAIAAEPGDVLMINGTVADKFEIDAATGAMTFVPGDCDAIASKATLYLYSTPIKNNDKMNLFVLPAKHETPEDYVISYDFDNVTLTYTKNIAAELKANRKGGLKLTIADQFPYIVTLGDGNPGTRSLIVNKGSIKDALSEDGLSIAWTDKYDTDGTVDFTDIETVLINENVNSLDAADWALLNKLTGAKYVTILNATQTLEDVSAMTSLVQLSVKNATKVLADAFGTNAANITKLDLPKVTSWKDDEPFAALTDLNLGSYDFVQPGEEVSTLFFNSNVQSSLVNCDIHSCTSLAPVFGYERKILFSGYTALTTIKLNANETILAADEFLGCANLTTVDGKVNIESGESAFRGCSSLATVNVTGTEIPTRAFTLSAVENVLYNGKQLAPTYVGKEAFAGNTAIKVMDLSKIEGTDLCERAFQSASNFIGTDAEVNVVTLNVTTVPAYAFHGTAIERFQLMKATKTMSGSLNSAALKQIKYRTALGSTASIATDQCSTNKGVTDIFVKTQADRDLFTGYATVTKEDKDW